MPSMKRRESWTGRDLSPQAEESWIHYFPNANLLRAGTYVVTGKSDEGLSKDWNKVVNQTESDLLQSGKMGWLLSFFLMHISVTTPEKIGRIK